MAMLKKRLSITRSIQKQAPSPLPWDDLSEELLRGALDRRGKNVRLGKRETSMEKNIKVRLIIEGRVQGVWFRESTRTEASRLGVFGWVKNRHDGKVEVLAQKRHGEESSPLLMLFIPTESGRWLIPRLRRFFGKAT
jgi:hypothetical protein